MNLAEREYLSQAFTTPRCSLVYLSMVQNEAYQRLSGCRQDVVDDHRRSSGQSSPSSGGEVVGERRVVDVAAVQRRAEVDAAGHHELVARVDHL